MESLRTQFPVAKELIYLNHAAVAPIAHATSEAMRLMLEDVERHGAWNFERWNETCEQARGALAHFIGATPAELAFLKNTSEGICTVARGLQWKPGDVIVACGQEFPANVYPWVELRQRLGVRVEAAQIRNGRLDLDELRRLCRGARLLSLSFVQFLSGYRLDVAAVGEICRETGTLFLLDAIQGLGAFPLDVKRAGVHFLAADGHKWLTGPEGCAIFFADEAVLEQLQVSQPGWFSVENANDMGAAEDFLAQTDRRLVWRRGAGRFESGTLNTVGIHGLKAAAALLQSHGVERIAAHILALTGKLRAGLLEMGAEVLGSEQENERSGIVSFRFPAQDSAALHRRLIQQRICCAHRLGFVRLSPHGYNTLDEMNQTLAAVRSFLA